MSKQDIVIIGSGIAGITTAREVRKLDTTASITLITADDGALYAKPMLSNAFAQGKTIENLVQKSAVTFAEELNVTVFTNTRVFSINRADKSLVLDGQDAISYDRLVLATGATPRAYQVEGSDAAPLHSVNDLEDYARLREALPANAKVLMIGAGLIGAEFANDLAGAGHRVSVVDPAPWPLGRLLPAQLGSAMATALQGAGIALHMGRSVQHMSNDSGWSAQLDDGSAVPFDIAISAIGLVANTGMAKDAGLLVEQGIRADHFLRTSDSSIYAIGDCAQTDAGMLPYIMPVMIKARALAHTLLGTDTPVHLPALPVSVKTPALPCVVCPPKPGTEGVWVVEGEGEDLTAIYKGENGQTLGFALCGSATKARQALVKDMPDLLAA